MASEDDIQTCDVAINIFAKPYQTALSLLSLLKHCRSHIQTLWLQFEPAGSRFDAISPYAIAFYLKERDLLPCEIFQPQTWFDCAVADPSRFTDPSYRMALRFEYAFEQSKARYLFLMHNDIVVHKDILAAFFNELGDAIAIGPLGQCWNCPASRSACTQAVLGRPPCTPDTYQSFQPTFSELCALYHEADSRALFRRSYSDGLDPLFREQPWPLPECRVNEWACLIDLARTRPHTLPFGSAPPIGGYVRCGKNTLDIGVAWFRAMHRLGLRARHICTTSWLTHFVGTAKKSKLRYAQTEEQARQILTRSFPDYMAWLADFIRRPTAH